MMFNPIAELCSLQKREEANGVMPPFGYCSDRFNYIFVISEDGRLVKIEPGYELMDGVKRVFVRRIIPRMFDHNSAVAANLLYDNARYALNIPDAKRMSTGNSAREKERTRICFSTYVATQHALLDAVDDVGAKAFLTFIDGIPKGDEVKPWEKLDADKCPDDFVQLLSSDKIGFRLETDEDLLHTRDKITKAIMAEKEKTLDPAPNMQDLVTGEVGPTVRIHGAIKGVNGGNATGCKLSSFNSDAFTSYAIAARDQAYASPAMSPEIEYAYTSMLNYLLSRRDYIMLPGDTSVFIWADSVDDPEAEIIRRLLNQYVKKEEQEDLAIFLNRFTGSGELDFHGYETNPTKMVYVFGIAPNAARIIIRFAYCLPFGEMIGNVAKHFSDCTYARNNGWLTPGHIFRSCLMRQSENGKAKSNKDYYGSLVAPVMEAILYGREYPLSLLSMLLTTVRAGDMKIENTTALIHAIAVRNGIFEGGIDSMNKNSIGYNCGRLFSILAYILKGKKNLANNLTHAVTAPMSAMRKPMMMALSELDGSRNKINRRKFLGELIEEITANIETLGGLPVMLQPNEQAAFLLGYEASNTLLYSKYQDTESFPEDSEE